MSAARATLTLIFVVPACFAIGIGVGLALAPVSGVEQVAFPPVPAEMPEPPGVLQVAPAAPVPVPVLGPAVPLGQLTPRKNEGPPASPPPKLAEPAAPLPMPAASTARPAAKPAADNWPCYHAPCRRGLFRRR